MIRLIASDMDSTLLGADGRVPEETFALIRRLRELGVTFVAASGRIHDVLRIQFEPVADLIDYVCANGCEVWVDGRRVYRSAFSPAQVDRLVAEVDRGGGLTAFMSNGHTMYVYGPRAAKLLEWFGADDAFESVEVALPSAGTEVIKVSLYGDKSCVDDGVDGLAEALGEELVVHRAAFDFIDVTPAGVDKGIGLARVMEERGIEAAETLAYGDAMNDAGMLELAGESVAMGNALPQVKEMCDRVIGTFREQAVQKDMAQIIERLERGR